MIRAVRALRWRAGRGSRCLRSTVSRWRPSPGDGGRQAPAPPSTASPPRSPRCRSRGCGRSGGGLWGPRGPSRAGRASRSAARARASTRSPSTRPSRQFRPSSSRCETASSRLMARSSWTPTPSTASRSTRPRWRRGAGRTSPSTTGASSRWRRHDQRRDEGGDPLLARHARAGGAVRDREADPPRHLRRAPAHVLLRAVHRRRPAGREDALRTGAVDREGRLPLPGEHALQPRRPLGAPVLRDGSGLRPDQPDAALQRGLRSGRGGAVVRRDPASGDDRRRRRDRGRAMGRDPDRVPGRGRVVRLREARLALRRLDLRDGHRVLADLRRPGRAQRARGRDPAHGQPPDRPDPRTGHAGLQVAAVRTLALLDTWKGMAPDNPRDQMTPNQVWLMKDYIPRVLGTLLESRSPWTYWVSSAMNGPVLAQKWVATLGLNHHLALTASRLYHID